MGPGASHDDFETRYWLRTAAAGGWVTILMATGGIVYLGFFAHPAHRLGLGLGLAVIVSFGLLALFAVLLPDTSSEEAEPVVARLSAALGERVPHCLGIATAPEQGSSFDDLYRGADAALYQCKLMRPGPAGQRRRVEAGRLPA